MNNEVAAISEFIGANKKALAGYLRKRMLAAGAKEYLDRLGKSGIEDMEKEAAGVLLDMACALLRCLRPEEQYQAESLLLQFPEQVRQTIRLPRSEAYYSVLAELKKIEQRP